MKSILIVGGGVIGLCTAWYAAQRGHRITLVERGTIEHDSCSRGNAGMIVPSHFVPLAAPGMVGLGLRLMLNPESPFALRPRWDRALWHWAWRFYRAANAAHVARSAPLLRDLHLASRRGYQEFAQLPGADFGLVQKGLLMLCRTEAGWREEAEVARQAHALDLPAEVLDPDATARLDPALRLNVAGSVYFPLDCHLVPQRFVAGLIPRLEAAGVRFLWGTEVQGWRTRAERIVAIRTTRGEFKADDYVVAGGAWSARLVRELGLTLPLQAGKGYSLTLPRPRRLPTVCSILVEARVAVTPMAPALRFAGTMEITGLDQSINPARVRGLIRSIPPYLPDFSPEDFRELTVWSGLRPCSPDGLPYVGRCRRFTNLAVATGHAMMGLSLAPITGRLLSQVLSEETPELDLSLLAPERFD